MSRMKTFFKYLLIFIAFYLFVSIMTYCFVITNYKDMSSYTVNAEEQDVTIREAKYTYVNGYVKGKVINNTSETMNGKYIKIAFLSSQGNEKITRYEKIDNLEPEDNQYFTIKYNAEAVTTFELSIVDNINDETVKKSNSLDENNRIAIFLSAVILMYYFL